jgi:hypothetical protein
LPKSDIAALLQSLIVDGFSISAEGKGMTPRINFYLVQPDPEMRPTRVKLGTTDSLKGRIATYRCICPELLQIGHWHSYQTWEKTVMDLCIGDGLIRRIKDEVFETNDLNRLKCRLDELFTKLNAARVNG